MVGPAPVESVLERKVVDARTLVPIAITTADVAGVSIGVAPQQSSEVDERVEVASDRDSSAINPDDAATEQTPATPVAPEVGASTTSTTSRPTTPSSTTSSPAKPSSTTSTSTTTTTTAVPAATLADQRPSTVRISVTGNDSNRGGAGAPVASLERAVQLVAPGGEIQFEPGVYGPLRLVGLKDVSLTGGSGVVISDDSYSGVAGIHIERSHNINISDMAIHQSLWGIYVSDSHSISLQGNTISDVGQEAIRLKDGTSDVLIFDNTISETGRRSPDSNGEGIYIGTGSPGGVDVVSDVIIEGNRISNTTDEAVDIKTPSRNIMIRSNHIFDIVTQTTGAVVLHLNAMTSTDPNITVDGNLISNVSRSSEFRDGNCIVAHTTVTIVNNVVSNCEHRGIHLAGSMGKATVINNMLSNTGSLGVIVDEGLGMAVEISNNSER